MIMSFSWDLLRSALDIFLLSHCILNDGRPMPMLFRVSVSIFDMNYVTMYIYFLRRSAFYVSLIRSCSSVTIRF